MSMSYWICEGVGIRANQLRPFLNPQKCIQLLKEQLPSEEISEDGFDILLTRGSGQKMSHQALRKSMSALSKPSSVSAT